MSLLPPVITESLNQAYNQNFGGQQQGAGSGTMGTLPISGKKNTNLGGSNETFGLIDTNFKTIYNDLFRFRKINRDPSLGTADKLFYALDQPGHYYFKIFFYFSNPYADPTNPISSNLLGTTYIDEDGKMKGERSDETNTALNYLYNNMEYTRFNSLAEFIQLLSDISTKSPWYFQSISGLDQAVERQEVNQTFKVEEERKQITIKCLPDAYDNRLGRLMDLYRSVVYSQNLHKWILPSNLRKFDMGIYIFNTPIKTIAGGRYGVSDKIADRVLETTFKDYYGDKSEDSGEYSDQMYKAPSDISVAGSKYIELRGCEFDYNSPKTAYAEFDNAEGKAMEYELIIKFDQAVEDRYDPIFNRYIGDFVIEDLFNGEVENLNKENPYSTMDMDSDYISGSIGEPYGDTRNTLLESVVGMGMGYMNTVVNKVLLGNIYGFSFGKLDSILTADPMSAIMSAGREVNNAKLIAKRISDFVDPGKGTRELSGRTLRKPDTDKKDEEWSLAGKNLGNGWTQTPSVSSLAGKSFRSPDTDKQDEEWSLEGRNFRSGWQPTPEDIEGKNFAEGWSPTPENIDGKSFSEGWSPTPENIEGKTIPNPDTDYAGEDWDLSGKNFYQP